MKFFKPNLFKLVVVAVMFAATATISPFVFQFIILESKLMGLPFPYVIEPACGAAVCEAKILWHGLVIDLTFWYLFATLIDYIRKTIKR